MTWAALLLADPSACLRWHVLRDIFHRPEDDPEVMELSATRLADPMVVDLLAHQEPDGSWGSRAFNLGRRPAVQTTALALARLGFLGFNAGFSPVQRGAEYLFSQQLSDGSWPLFYGWIDGEGEDTGGPTRQPVYDMIPLQTALPLYGLATCGFEASPECERAYIWLLGQQLPDGAWPTGKASGVYGGVAGYRRLPHSRWGCRSNTTGALMCLAAHPDHRASPAARRALDLLLGRETREQHTLGFETARLLGAEPARGFLTYYARFDLAQVLDLCARVGAGMADERVAGLVAFIRSLQGPYGLWEYPSQPQVSRWITFTILRSFSAIDTAGDWISYEPPTPFQPYPRRPRRF